MDANMPGYARYCDIYEQMEFPFEEVFRTYPNPATEYISFETNLKISGIRLLDVSGKEVANISLPDSQNRSYIPYNIREGIYFLFIQTDKGLKMERILIKKR